MPRPSKFEIATREALNILKSVSKKLDRRTVAKYERAIFNANRIDYVNRLITELNTLESTNQRHLTTPQIKSIVKRASRPALSVLEQPRMQVMPFRELKGKINSFVQSANMTSAHAELKPFKIVLTSGLTGTQKEFKFKNIYHFNNWDKKVNEGQQGGVDVEGVETSVNFGNGQNPNGAKQNFSHVNAAPSFIAAGYNKHESRVDVLKSTNYKFTCFNPQSMLNNCLFKCLDKMFDIKIDVKKMRKLFKITNDEPIDINTSYDIIKHVQKEFNVTKDIEIIDIDENNDDLDDNKFYILLRFDQESDIAHYYVVEKFEPITTKKDKTKRGFLYFDYETREDKQNYTVINNEHKTKMYLLKPTILCAYYKEYKQTEYKKLVMISNDQKDCTKQFLEFLDNEKVHHNRTYNIIAHNGANFDFYFIISALRGQTLRDTDIQLRGTSIIGINYRGHLFKDSCCFLTNSLKKLCQDFNVGDKGKITNIDIRGQLLTNEQLCFYKPELDYHEFLALQNNDVEFWTNYVNYCMYDCIALCAIWEKFTESVNTIIAKINPQLLVNCALMSCTTIGSLSKKLIVNINKLRPKFKRFLDQFIETKTKYGKVIGCDVEKYEFIKNFKRGGISHCNQMGKHTNGIVGMDIKSQYPAALMNCMIPAGNSNWFVEYKPDMHGFYKLKNVNFSNDSNSKFKPVAASVEGISLNWGADTIDELYVDSYLLKYIIKFYGATFEVEKALLSKFEVKGSELFGTYINVFYNEKAVQDALKESKDANYNEALRSCVKLFLNSLTGKLVEDPSIHYSLKMLPDTAEDSVSESSGDVASKKLTLNGVNVAKESNGSFNDWIVSGVMIYSYSKRLLFEYINCLPNKSDDVIHVETDGIYFSTVHKQSFLNNLSNYQGDYKEVMMGDALGNLDCEKTTQAGQVAYFLGKKFYCITTDKKPIFKIKGVPQKTINDDGTEKVLVNLKAYEDIYNGQTVNFEFKTIKRSLYSDNTSLRGFTMSRNIKPMGNYRQF
jgi:hypothetical protein